jgi:uroporphyrinogen-III synthase
VSQSDPSGSLPVLKGRRVVVTRQPSQGQTLIQALVDRGATVVNIPTIEVVEPSSWEPLDTAIREAQSFDWLVFTSGNAVRFFRDRLQLRPEGLGLVENVVVCAIGASTAREAQQAGFEPRVIPQESQAEGLLQSIIDYAGGETALKGLRFLLPRSNIARDYLSEALARLGVIVHSVEAYRTVLPEATREIILKELDAPVDVFTFSSPSTVQNLLAIVGAEALKERFRKSLAACIGPVTAKAAREAGFENVIYPKDRSSESLVGEISKYFS